MDVNSLGNNPINLQQLASNQSNGAKDADGDKDNSKPGEVEKGSAGQSTTSNFAFTVSFSVQAQQNGQTQGTQGGHHHHTFNAEHFFSKLDTANLTDQQKQQLKDILAKYDGSQGGKGTLQQIANDLKNAGFDVQKLFDNFRQQGQTNPGGQPNFSTTI